MKMNMSRTFQTDTTGFQLWGVPYGHAPYLPVRSEARLGPQYL